MSMPNMRIILPKNIFKSRVTENFFCTMLSIQYAKLCKQQEKDFSTMTPDEFVTFSKPYQEYIDSQLKRYVQTQDPYYLDDIAIAIDFARTAQKREKLYLEEE